MKIVYEIVPANEKMATPIIRKTKLGAYLTAKMLKKKVNIWKVVRYKAGLAYYDQLTTIGEDK